MWRLRWRWRHTQEEKWIWWTHMIREKQPFHNVGVKVWEWRSPWIICNKHTYIYIYLILLYLLNYFSFLNTKLLHPFIFYKCIAKGWSIQKQILKYWLCIDEQGWNVFYKNQNRTLTKIVFVPLQAAGGNPMHSTYWKHNKADRK